MLIEYFTAVITIMALQFTVVSIVVNYVLFLLYSLF